MSITKDVPPELDPPFVDPPKPAEIETEDTQWVSRRQLYILFGCLIFIAAVVIVIVPFFLYENTLKFVVASMAALIAIIAFGLFFV
jgi:VIT1/CCC1 family predicted Fe2+/Mn2+ transporter